MPTSARSLASSLPSSGKQAARPDSISPLLIGSSRLIARHSVDLPGTGWPDHHDDLAAVDVEVDVLEHVQVPEPLVDVLMHRDLDGAGRIASRRNPSSTWLVGASAML